MQFFLQLPLATLQMAVRGEGTLQLFYCSVDDGGCETWRPFSGAQQVRISTDLSVVAQHPKGLQPLRMRSVQGWTEFVDYPHPEEHEQLGLHYDYDFKRKKVSISCADLGIALRDLDDMDAAETIGAPEAGDKLGGWPLWVQSAEYPQCPQCMRTMELVMQIDSDDNVPHMFGDVGCGHITQCPAHPQVLAFGWACS